MTVLYFYQYFTSSKGAWGARVYEFARRWVERGDKVIVVTSAFDRSDLQPTRLISRKNVDGIDVRIINVPVSNKHSFPVRIMAFATYALIGCWYALRIPADVVVSSSGPLTAALPGLAAHYLRGRSFVFEVRDLWPEGAIQLGVLRNPIAIRLSRAFEKRCYRASKKTVALSESMAGWIRGNHPATNLDVVPNASDNQLASQLGTPTTTLAWAEGKRLVLYTGTLGLAYGCQQILDMAEVLQAKGMDEVEIVFIGDGKEQALLEDYATRKGLRNVRFLGRMLREEVFYWLSIADCALYVCRNLPFSDTVSPNKIFDAFACGVPVVQTTQGWLKDLLSKENCGITAQPEDPVALAEAVLAITTDRERRAVLGANAKRVALELFDRDKLASDMRRVLATVASGSTKLSPDHGRTAPSTDSKQESSTAYESAVTPKSSGGFAA